MANATAKGRKAARAESNKAGARQQGAPSGKAVQAPEKGICIICGQARRGTPAEPGLPIHAARNLRALLRLPAKHTVACSGHLGEANEKRAKYEKKLRDYRIGAALFFLFILVGSLIYGRADIGIFAPALLGALCVSLFPYFYYFPSFGK